MLPTPYEKKSGCLWGGATGDALGAPVEFLPHTTQTVSDYIEFEGNSGSITDDTQMTIFTLEAMLFLKRSPRILAVEPYFTRSYQRWHATQTFQYDSRGLDKWLFQEAELWQRRAPGNTCLSALKSGCGENDSKGCGGVMRTAPCGLLAIKGYDAFTLGVTAAKVTHGHPTGYLTAGFFSQLIHGITTENYDLSAAIDSALVRLKQCPGHEETLNAIEKAISFHRNAMPCTVANIAELGEGWVAEEALAISLFCALSFEHDFRSGVLAAVNITGDRDSTGAITGNILGAINGIDAIPQHWRTNLKERNVIENASNSIAP